METTSKQARIPVKRPMLAMLGVLIGAFVGMFSETSLNIALPQLIYALNISTASAQWLVTGYMLVIGIVLPFSSLLTKWFSTRQLVIFGLSDFLLGAIISALAPNFALLLVGRMVQGIATGIILPLMFTLAMQIFSPNKLGAAMGICALVIMFAPAVGPTLTGLILAKLSWNWIFWSFVPFLVIALLAAIRYLPNVGQITRPKLDFPSLFGSIIGFSTLVMGVSFASEFGFGSLIVLALLVIAIITLFFYTKRQLTLTEPILNLRIFKLRDFSVGASLVMIDFAIILSAMYLLPQYIQNGLLLPVALTGIIMLPGGIVNAIVSAIAGRLYDKNGATTPVQIGFTLALIGAVMLAFTSTTSSIGYVILAHVILMIGCPLAMSPAQTHALNALNGAQAADGSTIMNTLQQIVGAVATALATLLLTFGESIDPSRTAATAFTTGVHYGIYFTIALIILGLIISLGLRKKEK